MTPNEFKTVVEIDFKENGFNVIHVGKSFNKGVDFIAEKEDQRIAVQRKNA